MSTVTDKQGCRPVVVMDDNAISCMDNINHAIQVNVVAGGSDGVGGGNVNLNQVGGSVLAIGSQVSAASLPVVIASDQAALPVTGTFWQTTQPVSGTFWQATQPVSGTVTTTPPSHASTNVDQLNGTTVDTNSGSKSAGTLRVVLATDQPALTNKLLVTPDSVALPLYQSVNVDQVGGSTLAIGQQLSATSIPVVLPAAQITSLTPPTTVTSNQGTANATPWNQNVAQFGGSVVTIGQQVAGASLPVVLPAAQITTLTPPTTVTATQGTANATPWNENLSQVGGAAVTLGSKTSANSIPVVIASDDTVAISAASLPLPALAATSTKQSDGTQKTQVVDGSGNVIASTSNALNVDVINFPATQPISGTVSVNNGATATAVNPAFVVDNTAVPLSVDSYANLRTIGANDYQVRRASEDAFLLHYYASQDYPDSHSGVNRGTDIFGMR